MKKITALFLILLAFGASLNAQNKSMDALWDEYEKISAADKPKEAIEVLESIKRLAREENSVWEYYKACEKICWDRRRINWKERDAAEEEFYNEIEALDVPVASFFARRRWQGVKGLYAFAKEREEALRKGYHRDFYNQVDDSGHPYSKALPAVIKDDYQFALWSLYFLSKDKKYLEDTYKAVYPLEQFVEFDDICKLEDEERYQALASMKERYAGTGIGLMAGDEMNRIRFNKLTGDKGTSGQFKELYGDCTKLKAEKKKLSGTERLIADYCTQSEGLITELNDKRLECQIHDDTLRVAFRNLDNADITVTAKDSKVLGFKMQNTVRSFYAWDTVSFFLPATLDDAYYNVLCKSGDTECRARWEKFTLSASVRQNADGFGAYVTDYNTGKPLAGYEDGFKKIDGNEFQAEIIDNGRKRLSKKISCHPSSYTPEPFEEKYSNIICDRKAFRPEETVHFKVYCSQGGEVTAYLHNAQREIIDSLALRLNEFGTAAGEFLLKRQQRNGMFSISVKKDSQIIAGTIFCVDDFQLPSFRITFDKRDTLFLPGDTALISGSIESFSGHPVADAAIECSVESDGGEIRHDFVIDRNGRFKINFPIEEENLFKVYVKVTDPTGETHTEHYDFFSYVPVIRFTVTNEVKGRVNNGSDIKIVDSDSIFVEFRAGLNSPHKIEYELSRDGKVIRSGKTSHNQTEGFRLDQSGLYTIKERFFNATWARTIFKVGKDDRNFPESIDCFFKEGPADELELQVGSSKDGLWTVAEIYSPDNKLLGKTMLQGSGTIHFDWKNEFPDAVRLFALTFIDGQSYSYSEIRRRNIRSMDLPLRISRMRNKTSPDTEETIIIQTEKDVECAASVYDNSTNTICRNEWTPFKAALQQASTVGYFSSPGCNWIPYSNEEAIPFLLSNARVGGMPKSAGAASDAEEMKIRSDFASTIAWEPMLRSDGNGRIPLSFKASDKLGQFMVQLFAHDKKYNNAVLYRGFTVSLPVEVSIREPKFLYASDRYRISASVYNSSNGITSGTCTISAGNGQFTHSGTLNIPANSSKAFEFEIDVPDTTELDVLVAFSSNAGSDAVKVKIPVLKPVQTITEAHSSIFKPGQDRDSLVTALNDMFVNRSAAAPVVSERSIAEMIGQAYPKDWKPTGNDVLTLSSSLWLGTEYADKILACRNDDGGFGWFAGMKSSPIITAIVLERLRLHKELFDDCIKDAVHYLDHEYFTDPDRPFWRGGIPMEQYLYVRSMFKDIRCNETRLASLDKDANKYLRGRPGTIRNGHILGRARRALTNINLGKNARTVKADLRTLKQYAVAHPQGGYYFPNAVMPFRGLIESELYAHNKLCKLFDTLGEDDIANGIRLWMMVQKETQDWGNDPALADAVNSIRKAPKEILDTKVVSAVSTTDIPLKYIKASENGISIERTYSAKENEQLSKGDKVKATYTVRSDENRSFVVLTVPHCAGMTPVNQLSGIISYNVYRNVLYDRTEYWFEVCPEEKTVIVEDFYVSQNGSFQIPAATIECKYAPHYRGNGTSDQKHFSDSLTTNVLPPM